MKGAILVKGAYIEPRAYKLLYELFTELFADEMFDMEHVLHERLFANPQLLERRRQGFCTHRWELTDVGEHTLQELLRVAASPITPAEKRAGIDIVLQMVTVSGVVN